jgi:sugar O-acyltransferase (sialic acid O-acetyltransferase NeuD family)
MKRLAIIGAGELGQQILNLSLNNPTLEVVGFFDDTIEVGATIIYDYKVIGSTKEIESSFNSGIFDSLTIAIGYNHMVARKTLYTKYSQLIPFETLIHSSCIVDFSAKIGNGVILYPGCVIDKNVVIEDNVLLNLSVVVAHDTIIGTHSFLAPSVTISGFVKVGECNFIGTGSVFKDNLKICSNNVIGIGSVVVDDLTESGVYYGTPAKRNQKE